MNYLFENWRKYLNEETEQPPHQIYCDMDGVLVDFEAAAIQQINQDLKDELIQSKKLDNLRQKLSELGRDSIIIKDLDKADRENRLQAARNYMYSRFQDDEEFWANLPWMPGGKELWNYLSKFNPNILTAPMQGEGSKNGKQKWIENNLTPGPKDIFMSHEKYNWATDENGNPNILIDDFTTNTGPWREAGGYAILHTDVNSTIKELEELISNITVDEG